MFKPKNMVKELEAKGIIPVGKYFAAVISKSLDIIVVITDVGKFGLLTIDGKRSVNPQFDSVIKDDFGNYVCSKRVNKETYREVYDKNLNLVSQPNK